MKKNGKNVSQRTAKASKVYGNAYLNRDFVVNHKKRIFKLESNNFFCYTVCNHFCIEVHCLC